MWGRSQRSRNMNCLKNHKCTQFSHLWPQKKHTCRKFTNVSNVAKRANVPRIINVAKSWIRCTKSQVSQKLQTSQKCHSCRWMTRCALVHLYPNLNWSTSHIVYLVTLISESKIATKWPIGSINSNNSTVQW